ncbi:MAG: HypC/HybG/HupF family hydrogenase formation chaperone [Candidatus Omnitrophota bacterium]
MCLAIPTKVIKIKGHLAEVDIGGIRRQVDVRLLENLSAGDYILVHAGFGIKKVDEQEARESLKIWEEMDEIHRRV